MIAGFRTWVAPLGLIAFASGSLLPGCKSDEASNSDSKAFTPNAGSSASGGRGGSTGVGGSAGTSSAAGGTGGTNASGGAGTGGASPSGAGGTSAGAPANGGRGGTPSAGGSGGNVAAAGGSAGTLATGGAGTTSGAGGAAGGNAQGGSGGSAGGGAGPRKIIAIGDSITRATCWRAELWQTLNAAHAGKFDLVGTLKADSGCNVAGYDQDNQGYSSSLLTEVVAGVTNARTCDPKCPTLDDFSAAFTTTKPDVALIHYGTNDVWNGKPTNDITAGYSALLGALRAASPNVTVLIAKLIPMNVTGSTCGGCSCASCTTAIPALNTAIDAWATSNATSASAIVVVDQFTGFDADADTRDGVHPNDSGSQKMAAKWAAALEPLF